jgi:molybdopterin synthase catalytic subunit
MGGIATFLGCARDFSEGVVQVSEISFDAYASMAARRNAQAARRGDRALRPDRCPHRASARRGQGGRFAIVFIAAGAEHRAPALQACQWLIDELKERVPIWKKEITPQGESWVTPHP